MKTFNLVIESEFSGERLDRILALSYSDLSRTRIQDLLKEGHIKINGTLKPSSYRVKISDKIEIFIPPLQEAIPYAQSIPIEIIYEDTDLIVVNKPAGMVVHPAPGSPDKTLVNALLAHCQTSLSGIGGVKRPGIIHRLDKGTSGLLVVAKHDQAHQYLSQQFSSRTLSRLYYGLTWGNFLKPSGTIQSNIGRSHQNRQKMAILTSGGKMAITHYKVLKTFSNLASYVECQLETGRTHQIRVHLTSLNCPLIGDPIYGKTPKFIRNVLKEPLSVLTQYCTRPLLHAYQLKFVHPRTQQLLIFNSPLPPDFKQALELLDKFQNNLT